MTSADQLSVSWRKSSYSTNGGNCLEVGDGMTGVVPVRDSKVPAGPALMVAPAAWSRFVAYAVDGLR